MTGESKSRIRVLFYIKNLNGGGAERAVVDLVNGIDRTEFEPRLLLGNNSGEYLSLMAPEDLLDPGADSDPSESDGPIVRFLRRAWASFWARWMNRGLRGDVRSDQTRRTLQGLVASAVVRRFKRGARDFRPHVVVSSLMESASLHVYVARKAGGRVGPGYRWVAVEQNNTRRRYEAWYSRDELPFWRELTPRVYREADAVVAVSEGVKEGLVSHFGIDPGAIAVIPNHVSNEAVAAVSPAEPGAPAILAAGRLHYQKDFPSLVRAYALIADAVKEDLVILGEGEDREALEAEVRDLGLEGRVRLPGFADDLWARLKAASCFVLSSRFEGLPLSLLEAMSAGCPVVSFDCDYGPGEILTDGVDGLLVPPGNHVALADAMARVLTDDVLRQRLARNAQARAAAFDVRTSTARYETLLRRMASG